MPGWGLSDDAKEQIEQALDREVRDLPELRCASRDYAQRRLREELDAVTHELGELEDDPEHGDPNALANYRERLEVRRREIVEFLDDLEDIREGEAVLERVHSGQETVYSPEEAKRWLGLDDVRHGCVTRDHTASYLDVEKP